MQLKVHHEHETRAKEAVNKPSNATQKRDQAGDNQTTRGAGLGRVDALFDRALRNPQDSGRFRRANQEVDNALAKNRRETETHGSAPLVSTRHNLDPIVA